MGKVWRAAIPLILHGTARPASSGPQMWPKILQSKVTMRRQARQPGPPILWPLTCVAASSWRVRSGRRSPSGHHGNAKLWCRNEQTDVQQWRRPVRATLLPTNTPKDPPTNSCARQPSPHIRRRFHQHINLTSWCRNKELSRALNETMLTVIGTHTFQRTEVERARKSRTVPGTCTHGVGGGRGRGRGEGGALSSLTTTTTPSSTMASSRVEDRRKGREGGRGRRGSVHATARVSLCQWQCSPSSSVTIQTTGTPSGRVQTVWRERQFQKYVLPEVLVRSCTPPLTTPRSEAEGPIAVSSFPVNSSSSSTFSSSFFLHTKKDWVRRKGTASTSCAPPPPGQPAASPTVESSGARAQFTSHAPPPSTTNLQRYAALFLCTGP